MKNKIRDLQIKSIFQPTVYINLDHEVVFKKNLMGIFILSLAIISYNYFSILTSQGNLNSCWLKCQTK